MRFTMLASFIPIALVAGAILLIRQLFLAFNPDRDPDRWKDWRNQPFADPDPIGAEHPSHPPFEPTEKKHGTQPGFGARHRRSLRERTRFWSLHRHANSRF